jgi:hypothetical protein
MPSVTEAVCLHTNAAACHLLPLPHLSHDNWLGCRVGVSREGGVVTSGAIHTRHKCLASVPRSIRVFSNKSQRQLPAHAGNSAKQVLDLLLRLLCEENWLATNV